MLTNKEVEMPLTKEQKGRLEHIRKDVRGALKETTDPSLRRQVLELLNNINRMLGKEPLPLKVEKEDMDWETSSAGELC
jgi:hypothetical protein